MISANELKGLRIAACETAVSAGKLAQKMWLDPRTIDLKGFRDLVTDADIAVQEIITNSIQARFPDHGFLTEEENSSLPVNGPIIWIVDPIDGTTNYSRQLPEFCISIAACLPQPEGYQPLAGAIYDPMRRELFSAALGQGATLQFRDAAPQALQVSQIAKPADAVLCLDWSSSPDKRQSALNILTRLAPQSFTVRAVGSAVLAMAWVAAGRVDAYLNLKLRPWDLAAAQVLVQESGGAVSALNGGPVTWDVGGMECLVSNGRIQLEIPKS